MLIVFTQVLILFLFAAVGFLLAKLKVVASEHGKILSTLLLYVFFPANVFKTFARNCTVEYLSESWDLILASLIVTAAIAVGSHFAVKLFIKEDYERRIAIYSFVVPNCGYVGYTLVEKLFGEAALMNTMLFTIPISIYTYSIGFCLLTRKKLTPKKLLTPPIVAIVLGTVFALLSIPLPEFLSTAFTSAGSCVGPVSMLLAGITVAQFKMKSLLINRNAYIITLARLLLLPLLVAGVLTLIGLPDIAVVSVTALAMPCGLNTIVFPKLLGEDCKTGASLALFSNVAACLTIPFVFYLVGLG